MADRPGVEMRKRRSIIHRGIGSASRPFRWLSVSAILAAGLCASQPAFASQFLAVEAVYTGEIWSNLRGGLRRDFVYLDNADLAVTLDGEKAGLNGTTIFASLLYNNRNTLSESIVGDLQTISNIDTDGSLRLYEAWIEKDLSAISIKLGLIDLNSEFDVNSPGSLFINSSHGIGPDFSQIGESGPSIFPLTGLGIVGRAQLGGDVTLRAGLFEGTPGNPDRPRRMAIDLDDDEGVLLVGEIAHHFHARGKLAVGAWHHSGGRVTAIDPTRSSGASTGVYLHLEAPIGQLGGIDVDGFGRIGFADPQVHQIARYTGAGLTLSGPVFAKGEREEQIGLAIAVAHNGEPFRRARAVAGQPVGHSETSLELTYRIAITDYLALQPDLQYVVNPGTGPDLQDAIVAGLRFELSWVNGR